VPAWSAEWSHEYLRRLMAKVKSEYALETLARAPEVLAGDPATRTAFIRHDVDVSLDRARKLAELEQSWGVRATYHVMLSCPFYDVMEARSRDHLAAIRACGHEVGLHYHPAHDEATSPPHGADEEIAAACVRLEHAIGTDVRSVSFHLPSPGLIGGPLHVANRVNAYAKPLLEWYLSDSRGRWREGEPLATLDTPRSPFLQILVHPLWWGTTTEEPTIRLATLVRELADERRASFDDVAEMIQKHILVFPTVPPPAAT
jgi:hypothetical protein